MSATGAPPRLPWLPRLLAHPATRMLLPLAIVGVALFVLHDLAREVRWADVRADLAAAHLGALAQAVGATAASFLALSFYDVLAMRSVAPGRVPVPVAALAGTSGYAISNLLGFSWLTGTAVRYRIYAARGLDLGLVAGIIATSWMAFWMAAALILGLLLTLHPAGLSAVLPIGPGTETALGLTALGLLLGFFVWLARGRQAMRLAGFAYSFPPLRVAAPMMAVAVVDILGASVALYVLLPEGAASNFAVFFVVYVVAITLGILSHSPGGLGVFEATMIAGLSAGARADVLAALLLYRLVYTVLPFAITAAGLGALWIVQGHRRVGRAAHWTLAVARPAVPPVAAGVALLAGTLLLLSGNLPGVRSRLEILRDILPLPLVEASHLLGSIAGVLLIVVARGLYRKLARAWAVAMLLVAVGLVTSLLRGLDWQEALSLLAALGLLGAFRSAFYRVDAASVFRLSPRWALSVVALVAASFWVGLFAYSHVAYRDTLWWQFAWHGDASRFLRASLAAAVVLLAVSLNSLVMSRGRRTVPQPVPPAVRELLARCPHAEAQIALTGDKSFLVAPGGAAFIAYADTGTSLIAKGDPVGEAEAARKLIWALREQADRTGRRCVFYAVTPEFLPTYLDLGLSILKIGEVARVKLDGFTLEGPHRKDFRYAIGRAARDGYRFEIVAAADLPPVLPALRTVSDAWLEMKQGEEKSFAVGAFEEAYLLNFDHAVLRHAESGRIVAFATILKGADLQEVSLDLMRHHPAGPKIAMDALFGHLMLWAKDGGYVWFNLGAAPLSGLETHKLATTWNRIGGFVYTHGEQFYNFEGLRAFKQKFDPDWTPHYLASPGGLAVPRVLYEVNALVSGGLRGLIK